ncbi:Uncharacterised protein [Vibrio cholerae]|nr:Uncharacterised protein [Vibrio cholerae]
MAANAVVTWQRFLRLTNLGPPSPSACAYDFYAQSADLPNAFRNQESLAAMEYTHSVLGSRFSCLRYYECPPALLPANVPQSASRWCHPDTPLWFYPRMTWLKTHPHPPW